MLPEKRTASALVVLLKRLGEKRAAITARGRKTARAILAGSNSRFLISWKGSPEEGFKRYYTLTPFGSHDFSISEVTSGKCTWDDVHAIQRIDRCNALTLPVPSSPIEQLAHALKCAEGMAKWRSIVERMYGYSAEEQVELQKWIGDLQWTSNLWQRQRVVLQHLSILLRNLNEHPVPQYNNSYSYSKQEGRPRIHIDGMCFYWDRNNELQPVDIEDDITIRGDIVVSYPYISWMKGKGKKVEARRKRAKTANLRDYVERRKKREQNNNDNGK